MVNVVIRKSTKSDCPEIVEMIKELAKVEELLDQVKISSSMLIEDGFGEVPYYHAFVAEDVTTKEIVGFTIFVHHYSGRHGKSIHMEDLFVKLSHRKQGIGSKLMKAVAEYGAENGCSGLHLHCIEWNVGPMEMYKRRGAKNISETEEWQIMRFNSPEFEKLFLTD